MANLAVLVCGQQLLQRRLLPFTGSVPRTQNHANHITVTTANPNSKPKGRYYSFFKTGEETKEKQNVHSHT